MSGRQTQQQNALVPVPVDRKKTVVGRDMMERRLEEMGITQKHSDEDLTNVPAGYLRFTPNDAPTIAPKAYSNNEQQEISAWQEMYSRDGIKYWYNWYSGNVSYLDPSDKVNWQEAKNYTGPINFNTDSKTVGYSDDGSNQYILKDPEVELSQLKNPHVRSKFRAKKCVKSVSVQKQPVFPRVDEEGRERGFSIVDEMDPEEAVLIPRHPIQIMHTPYNGEKVLHERGGFMPKSMGKSGTIGGGGLGGNNDVNDVDDDSDDGGGTEANETILTVQKYKGKDWRPVWRMTGGGVRTSFKHWEDSKGRILSNNLPRYFGPVQMHA